MPSVALVTCRELPDGDEDGPLLDAALEKAGAEARWIAWDDAEQRWQQDLVVLRSTWDYTGAREAFLAWASRMPRLANPSPVIEWNSDKVYLRDLARSGVPIVDTTFVEPGEPVTFPAVDEVIVKPSVGAGSKGVGRFPADDLEAAREHVRRLHASGRTVLVQPYLSEVDVRGETALVYLDGSFSHAVTKGAMVPPGAVNPLDPGFSHSLYVEERISPAEAGAAELEVGERVMRVIERRFGGSLLYARVDLLPSPEGPMLVELELTEPSLFLTHAPGSADRFAAAIMART